MPGSRNLSISLQYHLVQAYSTQSIIILFCLVQGQEASPFNIIWCCSIIWNHLHYHKSCFPMNDLTKFYNLLSPKANTLQWSHGWQNFAKTTTKKMKDFHGSYKKFGRQGTIHTKNKKTKGSKESTLISCPPLKKWNKLIKHYKVYNLSRQVSLILCPFCLTYMLNLKNICQTKVVYWL